MLRFLTAGESHGRALVAIIEGLPAGLALDFALINNFLQRRQGGYGRGARMKIECDQVEIISGVRGSFTLGTPLALMINNRDWENWREIMAVGPEAKLNERVVHRPRPGHADLAGGLKYQQKDLRNILERASARETAIRTAVGAIAQQLLAVLGIRVQGQVSALGGIQAQVATKIVDPQLIAASPLFCGDKKATALMLEVIKKAEKEGDSLGGIVQVVVDGLPPGLGSHVHWDRRLDGRLAQALMSIPAIKGVEIGAGFSLASRPGSQAHDVIKYNQEQGFYHQTNHAGGLEGGLSNGEPLVLRLVMKPIPTLAHPLTSIDWWTKEEVQAAVERADVCAVPAVAVVAEAVVAWVLAEAVSEMFAGDHIREVLFRYHHYLAAIK